MITRIVKMSFKEGEVEVFLNIFAKNHSKIRSYSGCKALKLLRDVHSPTIFFTISEWETLSDLKSYRNSTLFKETWKMTRKLFDKKAEAWSTKEHMIAM